MESESRSGLLVMGYPYTTGSVSEKDKMKEEVVQLGVELSLSLAESMFLICDDIRTMLWFCRRLLRYTIPPSDPVLQRLLLVIHSIYTKHIQPKKGGYQHNVNIISLQWDLIKTTWKDFTDGIVVLHRLVLHIGSKDNIFCFDDWLLYKAIGKYKHQVLKKIGDKLRVAKDVSEANGFAREMVKSDIVADLWKSLFDEEVTLTPQVIRDEIVSEMFPSFMDESLHSEIQSLPVYSPYILGEGFAKEELKEEVVRLGTELSLYVAESMFLLCDDIPSMLGFCFKLWRDSTREHKHASPVGNRLLRGIHYVYTKHIKPKKGVVYRIGDKSVQWAMVLSTLMNFEAAFTDLNTLALNLIVLETWSDGRESMSRVEEAMKKVDEKLSGAKANNEFARDGAIIKSNILELWKSLCDKEIEEPWAQKLELEEMISELFHPLLKGGGGA